MNADRRRAQAPRVFTTRELARLAQLSPARVRRCVEAGFLQPRRGLRRRFEYDFRDVLLLRATRTLLDARIGPRRVAELLAELRRQIPQGKELAAIDLKIDGDKIVAKQGGHRWQAESGQMLFDFEGPRRSSEVHSLVEDDDHEAYRAFTRALALEEVSPRDAIVAYKEALRRDPEAVPVHVNLGRLEHQLGNLATAEAHYLEALRLDPEEETAAFNLAVLAEDQGKTRLAIRRYQQLLSFAPGTADAHQRLARLYGRIGKHGDARTHMRSYRRLLRPG